MKIKEHDCIVLTAPIPVEGLEAGDVGTIIHIHGEGAGYEVEFTTVSGETIAVATVLPSQLRLVSPRDVAHARETSAGLRR